MKTPEQLKGAIRNLSKEKCLNPNSLLHMCLFEDILEKLSKSKYRNRFILKGGLLISSLIGVDMRSTMDMDTTVVGIPLKEEIIKEVIEEVLREKTTIQMHHEIERINPIRKKDIYEDYPVTIVCSYGKIKALLKIDITTGDIITPGQIEYNYVRIFEDSMIPVMSYPIETIIAKKFETISTRSVFSTRVRDFYDLYILSKSFEDRINRNNLSLAIFNTATQRVSLDEVKKNRVVLEQLRESEVMRALWDQYALSNAFATDISYEEVLEVYKEIAGEFNGFVG